MKKLFAFLFLAQSLCIKAQVFDIDTLLYNGVPDKHINIVIVGDGYTATQMNSFVTDAQKTYDYMFATSPYQEYKNYFNVFIIKVPSIESGITHPANATDVTEPAFPVTAVNTYFNSTFDYASIHRLVVPNKTSALISVLASNFPTYDQVLVIANSEQYGGSGGTYATFTVNQSSIEIAMHEIGHSFSGLADEYWAGDVYARETYNLTKETSPTLVRWKNWYGVNNVGIYQHAGSGNASQWYKPHQSCKMQALGNPYCSVCKERIVERIHELSSPVDAFSPANSTTINSKGSPLNFAVNLMKPKPNTLKTAWKLNNTALFVNKDSININPAALISGENKLSFTVIDTISFTKDLKHQTDHVYSVLWTIEKSGSTSITRLDNNVKLEISPNPTNGWVLMQYQLSQSAHIHCQVFDLRGKAVKTIINNKYTEGGVHKEIIDLTGMTNGLYMVQLKIDNHLVTNKIQVIK